MEKGQKVTVNCVGCPHAEDFGGLCYGGKMQGTTQEVLAKPADQACGFGMGGYDVHLTDMAGPERWCPSAHLTPVPEEYHGFKVGERVKAHFGPGVVISAAEFNLDGREGDPLGVAETQVPLRHDEPGGFGIQKYTDWLADPEGVHRIPASGGIVTAPTAMGGNDVAETVVPLKRGGKVGEIKVELKLKPFTHAMIEEVAKSVAKMFFWPDRCEHCRADKRCEEHADDCPDRPKPMECAGISPAATVRLAKAKAIEALRGPWEDHSTIAPPNGAKGTYHRSGRETDPFIMFRDAWRQS